jgi:hypothetical protein
MASRQLGPNLAPIRGLLTFIIRLYLLIFAIQTDTAFGMSWIESLKRLMD